MGLADLSGEGIRGRVFPKQVFKQVVGLAGVVLWQLVETLLSP